MEKQMHLHCMRGVIFLATEYRVMTIYFLLQPTPQKLSYYNLSCPLKPNIAFKMRIMGITFSRVKGSICKFLFLSTVQTVCRSISQLLI